MTAIKPITTDQTLALRRQVLWPDKPLEFVRVPNDEIALHLGAFEGDALIGVASFYPDGRAAQLRKLAVDPSVQGQGIGAQLVLAGAELLRGQAITTLWCDARETALGFYTRLRFTIDPASFDKSGVQYRKAFLTL